MSEHIEAKKGDIAKIVLLPGDPLRAKHISETFLDDPRCYNTVRNALGYTGTYKDKDLGPRHRDGDPINFDICRRADQLLRV